MRKQQYPGLLALIAFILLQPAAVIAQTSFQFQYGKLTNPFSGASEYTSILTVQQAAQWQYGDSFFFIDFLEDGVPDGFNDKSIYGEWYPTLSIGKLTNTEISIGPIRDISIIAGFNADSDANVLKYLPGVRASWNVPGFFFVNTDPDRPGRRQQRHSARRRAHNEQQLCIRHQLGDSLRDRQPDLRFLRSCRIHRFSDQRIWQRSQKLAPRAATTHL